MSYRDGDIPETDEEMYHIIDKKKKAETHYLVMFSQGINPRTEKVSRTFQTKEQAVEHAQKMNSILTPEQKSYSHMRYYWKEETK
jgi:hypothetical protein